MSETIYEHEVVSITGEAGNLEPFRGRVMLIVNTASACGLTPQFAGLEELYKKHADEGLVVLGFLGEVLSKLPLGGVVEKVSGVIEEKLAQHG